MGIERLKEALEANDWDGGDIFGDNITPDDFDDFDDDDGEGSLGFGINAAEMEEEMAGMKQAIYGGGAEGEPDETDEPDDQDDEVEKLQAMMLKMQAVRGKLFSWSLGIQGTSLANNDRYGGGFT